LYNLAKKKELAKKTGSAKVAADKAAREAPIKEMNRRSAEIKSDIKKRTTATKQLAVNAAKGSKRSPKARSSKQRALLAIKFKKK
jgi:hypothetical protein